MTKVGLLLNFTLPKGKAFPGNPCIGKTILRAVPPRLPGTRSINQITQLSSARCRTLHMRIGLANMSDGDGSLAAALPSPSSSPAAAPPSSTTNFTHNTPKSWTRLELVVVMLAGAAVFDWLFSFLLFDDAAYAELSSFDERMLMLVLRVVCAAVGACLALSAVTVRVIVPLVREARALKEAKRSAEALRARMVR